MFNPDCDSATLLDYVRRRAVKDTEAYARQADARVSAFVGEVANDLARARAAADRISRSLEGEVDAEDEAAVAERAEATAAAEQAAAKVARLEELEKVRTAQKDALINGVGLFKGLDAVDLQEEGGAALNLRSDPKRNAKDVLGHRKTYVVVRILKVGLHSRSEHFIGHGSPVLKEFYFEIGLSQNSSNELFKIEI